MSAPDRPTEIQVEGLHKAFTIAAGLHPVVVAGSFYLAGEAMEVLRHDFPQ